MKNQESLLIKQLKQSEVHCNKLTHGPFGIKLYFHFHDCYHRIDLVPFSQISLVELQKLGSLGGKINISFKTSRQ